MNDWFRKILLIYENKKGRHESTRRFLLSMYTRTSILRNQTSSKSIYISTLSQGQADKWIDRPVGFLFKKYQGEERIIRTIKNAKKKKKKKAHRKPNERLFLDRCNSVPSFKRLLRLNMQIHTRQSHLFLGGIRKIRFSVYVSRSAMSIALDNAFAG